MSVQIVLATTGFGLATVAAAVDEGQLPEAERRLLLLSNNAATPEVTPGLDELAGFTRLREGFDAIVSWNELIAPQHPSSWRPRAEDVPLWQRVLSRSWDLDADVTLVLESIWAPPALSLATLLPDARIVVYGEGLMSYGPTRSSLPLTVAPRVERLLHLDLLPGVRPLLLSELEVPATAITGEAFAKVVAGLEPVPGLPEAPRRSIAVLLGQYLAATGLLSAAEEQALHLRMVTGAVAAGFRTLVFKPHPASPAALLRPLELRARRLGAELVVADGPALVESWFRSERIGLVVGCFSTALATASAVYGLPVARVGTDQVLRSLRPFENSNRVPAAVIDASVPDLAACALDADDGPAPLRGSELEEVLRAVGYVMQPDRYPELRSVAAGWAARDPGRRRRYTSRRRMTELDLPGRLDTRSPGRRVLRRLLGRRRYATAAGWWRRRRSTAATGIRRRVG